MAGLSYIGAVNILLTRITTRIEMLNETDECRHKASEDRDLLLVYYAYLQNPTDRSKMAKDSGLSNTSEAIDTFYEIIGTISQEIVSEVIIESIVNLGDYMTNRRLKVK